jgi:PHP family Zn ribbon phosphoesterase
MKTYCEKCHLYHAPNQTKCYCCEKCGGNVKQDLSDRLERQPNHPNYDGVTYPVFICVDCGKSHFWD